MKTAITILNEQITIDGAYMPHTTKSDFYRKTDCPTIRTALAAMETFANQSRWVSVSERLPEEGSYLVWCGRKGSTTYHSKMVWFYPNSGFFAKSAAGDDLTVTHWQSITPPTE